MIASLMLDLDDAPDFPGNTGTALGRAFAAYPLMAAKSARHVGRHFVASDSPAVKAVALQYAAILLDPPTGERTLASLLSHGLAAMTKELRGEDQGLELLVLLFSNAPAVTAQAIDDGIEALHGRSELDSAATVSPHNRFPPLAARREGADGLLEPWLAQAKADPQSAEAWYPDWGAQVLRPAKIERPDGAEPYPWLGRKVLPLKQWGGGPIDYQWQVPAMEFWLKKHGVTDSTSNLERQPKPQAAPKGDRR